MKPERIAFFKSYKNKQNLTYNDFTSSEILEIIEETPLNELDKEIARLRFVERCTFDLIAEKVGRDTRTVKTHCKKISLKLKQTCVKLFTN